MPTFDWAVTSDAISRRLGLFVMVAIWAGKVEGFYTLLGGTNHAAPAILSYNIASAYALINRPEEAMKWLQVTADEGFPCYPLFEGVTLTWTT
ncbi:MAG: hypothetical protein DMG71_20220 [Acidobacteria bacterium]|nr:MAG: hypothetical protein DMG71_20220 [Acidobacteriota bacterium]